MTLTSMHRIFQVPIDLCNHSSPNFVWISTFPYNCVCEAEVAINTKLMLHSRNGKSYWNFEVFVRVPRLESNYVSIYKLQPSYFVMGGFGEAFTVKGENCAEHIYVECPENKK